MFKMFKNKENIIGDLKSCSGHSDIYRRSSGSGYNFHVFIFLFSLEMAIFVLSHRIEGLLYSQTLFRIFWFFEWSKFAAWVETELRTHNVSFIRTRNRLPFFPNCFAIEALWDRASYTTERKVHPYKQWWLNPKPMEEESDRLRFHTLRI